MKISYIVPVYNTEKYVAECIESLILQKGENEIVIINDGSPDNSLAICEEYAKKYNNIKLLTIKNGGPGNARNVGAKMATGDYITFVDSDDYVSADLSENIVKAAKNNPDLMFFCPCKLFGEERVDSPCGFEEYPFDKMQKEEVLEKLFGSEKCSTSTWAKVIKRSFYEEMGIAFSSDLVGEDIDWSLELIVCAKSFANILGSRYFYRQLNNSRSAFGSIKSVNDQLTILKKWVKKAEESQYKETLMLALSYNYAMILPYFASINKKERKLVAKDMKAYKYLLSFGKTKKIKLVRGCIFCLGLTVGSKALKMYVEIRNRRLQGGKSA